MVARHLFLNVLSVFLLCQCATKHQPIRFPATFQKFPEDIFSPSTVKECRLLESKDSLTPLEKKRLMDLYAIEAKHIKAGSERFQEILAKTDQLRPEVEELMTETEKIKSEVFLEKKETNDEEKNNFQNIELKKEYAKIYRLWNQDENETALKNIKELVANSEFAGLSSSSDWLKVLNLYFRIAHDQSDMESISTAYQQLRTFDACSTETSNAALLYSLSMFAKNDSAKAAQILEEQCDSEESLTYKTRKIYWLYRFNKSVNPALAESKFQELKTLPLPGYYLYLASSERGDNFVVPQADSNAAQKYLDDEFEVPSTVKSLLTKAEERINAGLKKDSGFYLAKAVESLKNNVEKNLIPLLYIANLYRAAGNHLESMKTFSLIVSDKRGVDQHWASVLHSEFLEMFPKPFSEKVSWLAKEWSIDEDFIYSIMRQESAFNPGAVSATDARGLMQLMPSLARSLSRSWKYQPYASDRFLFQAEENLKLSSYHLHQLQRLAPHYALIAASYNAGLRRTSRWWKKFGQYPLDIFVEFIPVNETRNYVKLVLRNYLYYKGLRTGGSLPPNLISMKLPEMNLAREVSSSKIPKASSPKDKSKKKNKPA